MAHDQCPSTKGLKEASAPARDLPTLAGRAQGSPKVWRSPEEFADAPEFRDWVEREFPAGASELAGSSRRDFVKFMGASLALAGAATIPGCRRPDHKIYTYSKDVPEEVIPGTPLFFATSLPVAGGGAEGVVVETHEGRPTKVEGNPLHPVNQGTTSAFAQASVLELYDPDRLKFPVYDNPARGKLEATWDDFKLWQREHFAKFDESGGVGLAFIADRQSSPTRDAVRERIRQRWPSATWVSWDPVADETGLEGFEIAFGTPQQAMPRTENAKIIVSLDDDLLNNGPAGLANARGVAAGRRVLSPGDNLSRIYAIESTVSLLGASADHRLALAPSQIPMFAIALAKALQQRGAFADRLAAIGELAASATIDENAFESKWVDAIADDLMLHRGESLVVAGRTQPPAVRALVHAINETLGNIGRTISYRRIEGDDASLPSATLRVLTRQMSAGEIDTLVCLGANPLYDAPANAGLQAAWDRVPTTVTHSVGLSETEGASTWSLNAAHPLESWGDTQAFDGTIAPIQPMIAPLYSPSMSQIELLALLADPEETPDGYELVREAWRARLGGLSERSFEPRWRRALHDGVLAGTTSQGDEPGVVAARVVSALNAMRNAAIPTRDRLDVVFRTGRLGDGRYANNAWLQELPPPDTYVVWDNPVLMSPNTARELGVWGFDDANEAYTGRQIPRARMAQVVIDGASVELPAWVCPGLPDNTLIMELGYGRRRAGHVGGDYDPAEPKKGHKVGFDAYRVRHSDARFAVSGATCQRARGRYPIASTQNHWSLEGRDAIIREADHPAWEAFGGKIKEKPDPIYGEPVIRLNFAERLGELSHTPENRSIYDNPYNNTQGDPPEFGPDDPVRSEERLPGMVYDPVLDKWRRPNFARGPQWGMTIDMATCTGCGVCTIACQSENNIPVVGKREVAKGREMHWIRVDRYFLGDLDHPEGVAYQPVACVQCENAPCEVVCPVNATVHDDEGLNAMVYNRCIGTRYCSNNCPYKVRRFNFFDYSQAKFNGGSGLTEALGVDLPNENFIPPRLREKLDEIQKMRMNPDVTVRGRGVMEKCTYCVQRINRARYEMKLQDIKPDQMPDGFFQTACQQACPSQAISFGNILDESSEVSTMRGNGRSFGLLGYINTRPRTSHLLKVRNPNPVLRTPVADPFHHGGHGDDHGDDHGNDHGANHDGDHGGTTHDDGHGEEHSRGPRTLSLPVLLDQTISGALA
ncbi:MAG: TAT-variant-translocated molybdopterin oxidoreductase [Planctomycetota bacterium]